MTLVIALALVGLGVARHAVTPAHAGGAPIAELDWPVYGHDLGGMRYVDTDQINRSTVAGLKPAWIFHTNVMNKETSFESQPIEVGGTLYVSSPHDHVFAVSSHRAGVVESAFQEAPSERDAAPWATRLARLGNW